MNLDSLRRDAAHWGWMRTLFSRVLGRLQAWAGLHVFRAQVRPLPRHFVAPDPPDGITVCVLQVEQLLEASADPELGLDPEFIRITLAQGDLVCGAYEGGRLVGYAWRTAVAAPFYNGLWVKAGYRYHYAYQTFVLPSHRGRQVHTAILRLADRCSLERGCTAEIDLMPVHNLASRGAARSLGRRGVGYAGYLSVFGNSISFRTPQVRDIGVVIFKPHARIPIGLVHARSYRGDS
jgi:GNAT superfamily N-acetyltransferase